MHARAISAGAAATLSVAFASIGTLAPAIANDSLLAPLARILDAYTPLWLALALIAAIICLVLGARRLGVILSITVLASVAGQTLAYREVTRAFDAAGPDDFSVLFFNAFAGNTEDSARIVEAAIATGADVLVFAEARAVMGSRDALTAAYAFVSPCHGEMCELLIATNLPVRRSWQLQLNPAWAERYAVTEVEVPGHGGVFIAAVHLAKPWLSGIAEAELARLEAQLNWLSGPSVVVGDFNMPPWSQPMRRLLNESGFTAPRHGPGTWPAGAPGPLRLPIDHVLVRDQVSVRSVEPFGAGLGSNHLGVFAELSLR